MAEFLLSQFGESDQSFNISQSIMLLKFFYKLNFNSGVNASISSWEFIENSLTTTLSSNGDLILNKS